MEFAASHSPDAARLVTPMGDAALRVEFAASDKSAVDRALRRFSRELERASIPGLIEFVPGYTTVVLHYDPLQTNAARLAQNIEALWNDPLSCAGETTRARIFKIPVLYGGDAGPDLDEVAAYHSVSAADVVERHSGILYRVQFIGFLPGFPYLEGLPDWLATPRRGTPRVTVPAGSVGIGGNQTGIYPLDSPGGWHLIGRTPVPLYLPNAVPPSLLAAGDALRFVPIGGAEFDAIERRVAAGEYAPVTAVETPCA